MARKKTVTPPTVEQQLAAAHAKSAAALSVFEVAARDLEDAAAEADTLSANAAAEAAYLEQIAADADEARVAFTAKAAKIRELIGA